MQEREFVSGSKATWQRLAASVEDARKTGVTKLGADRLRSMHDDYRVTAADLAYAQTHFPGTSSEEYLNRLVGQAHGELYGAAPRRLSAMWRFLSSDYPALLRRSWRPIALSALLLLGAAAIGYLLVYTDYSLARMFLPEQLRESVADNFKRTQQANASMGVLAPALSGYIAVNNLQVAAVAFAGGMTAGVLTVYSLLMNGTLLGVLAGVFAQAGLTLDFWALIVPHGALELPAIVIAGGAGLMVAGAIVMPGDLPRMTALRRRASAAVRLVLGTLPMFAIAAVIEGFFTPAGFDPLAKVAFGVSVAALLAVYWGFAGRAQQGRGPRG